MADLGPQITGMIDEWAAEALYSVQMQLKNKISDLQGKLRDFVVKFSSLNQDISYQRNDSSIDPEKSFDEIKPTDFSKSTDLRLTSHWNSDVNIPIGKMQAEDQLRFHLSGGQIMIVPKKLFEDNISTSVM